MAINSAHSIAFHRGLGNSLHPVSSTPFKHLTQDLIGAWSTAVYAPSNFAVVANGADHPEFSKWAKQFFGNVKQQRPSGNLEIKIEPSKYYGGEERISHGSGSSIIIAFPGSSAFTGKSWKPEIAVLGSLLGGESAVKWSPGFSLLAELSDGTPGLSITTTNYTYSDAGLLAVALNGTSKAVAAGSKEVVEVLKSIATNGVSEEAFKKAVATARFQTLESGESLEAGLELTGSGLVERGKPHQIDEVSKTFDKVTLDQVKKAAAKMLEGKASVSTVGEIENLPYAEEIGLKI